MCKSRSEKGIFLLILAVVFSAVVCYSSAEEGDQSPGNRKETLIPDDYSLLPQSALPRSAIPDQDTDYISLYADHKARRMGDIVTIIIAESSKASKSTATSTSKKSGSNGSLSDFFGLASLPLKMGADAESDYSGSGTTTRSGSMNARISASVKEVLPNGNLVLEGTRRVTVNDDIQIITVSGIVRPEDIRSDNTVLSIYMADAQIRYDGKGPMMQKPGILTRILQTPFHWIAGVFRRVF